MFESDGYLALVNEGAEQPASGEWSRLTTPWRSFDYIDGGCVKFEYQSRFMDLAVYLLMTSSSTSHSSLRTRLIDIRHDGQVRASDMRTANADPHIFFGSAD